MTKKLGDILREEASAQAIEAATAQREKEELEQAKRAIDAAEVAKYFKGLKVKIATSLAKNSRPLKIEQGRPGAHDKATEPLGMQNFFWKDTCQGEKHPAHGAWVRFQRWAKTQGLAVRWKAVHGDKCDDAGYPVESWWELEITAGY